MTLHRERQLVCRHTVTVIGHFDAVDTAAFKRNLDTGGTGVQRVLDQFLERGGRPLDHLACGDTVDQSRGQ